MMDAIAWDTTRRRLLGLIDPGPASPDEVPRNEWNISAREVSELLLGNGVLGREIVSHERLLSRRKVALVRTRSDETLICKWVDGRESEDAFHERDFLVFLQSRVRQLDGVGLQIPKVVGTRSHPSGYVLTGRDHMTAMRTALDDGPSNLAATLFAIGAELRRVHEVELIMDHEAGYWRVPLPAPASTSLTVEEYSYGCGAGHDEYLSTLQGLEPYLVELHARWALTDQIVNLDLRSDNVLVDAGGPGPTRPPRLIDWEFAGIGDGLYDVGTLAAAILLSALRNLKQPDDRTYSSRSAVSALLVGYQAGVRALSSDELCRVQKYCGLALLMHSLICLQQLGGLGSLGHACLAMGRNLVRGDQLLSIFGEAGDDVSVLPWKPSPA